MRHRSHIAFILLAAALFAAPQMAQDLSALKGALAARIRGEIMQAFLGLHSNESAAPAKQSPRADASLLACGGESAKPETQPAQSRTVARSTPARRSELRTQAAMLTDPADRTNAGLPPAAVADELASLPRQVLTETRLAMLTPPSNSVEPPHARAFLFESRDARAKAAPMSRDNFRELEKHAVFLKVNFERGADSDSFRRAAEDAARVAIDGAKSKSRVQKVRRPARACGDDKAPCAFAPLPVASLPRPYVYTQISDGE